MNPMELPPEIWCKIFDKVSDAQDWLNLYRAAPSWFGGLVGDKVMEKLGHLALPHVFEQFKKGGATLGELLELRLVCHQWGQVLEQVVVRNWNNPKSGGWEGLELYDFSELESITAFLEQFDKTHARRSPFILGSSVSFEFHPPTDDGAEVAEYEAGVRRLLDRFGPHVKSLTITDYPQHGDIRDCGHLVRRLRNVVQATPNLASLKVYSLPCLEEDLEGHDVRGGGGGDGAEEVVVPHIEGDDHDHPQPITPNLKTLRFSVGLDEWSCVSELQNAVLRMCGHESTLKTLEVVGVPSECSNYFSLESALISLTTKEEIVPGLRRLVSSWPALSSLTLTTLITIDQIFSVQDAFEYASYFRDTLVSLEIRGGNWRRPPHCWEDNFKATNLPHLTSLTLPELLPLQVVDGLGSLERICFHYNSRPGNDTAWAELSQTLKANIRDSGIWRRGRGREGSLAKLANIDLSYGVWDGQFEASCRKRYSRNDF